MIDLETDIVEKVAKALREADRGRAVDWRALASTAIRTLAEAPAEAGPEPSHLPWHVVNRHELSTPGARVAHIEDRNNAPLVLGMSERNADSVVSCVNNWPTLLAKLAAVQVENRQLRRKVLAWAPILRSARSSGWPDGQLRRHLIEEIEKLRGELWPDDFEPEPSEGNEP